MTSDGNQALLQIQDETTNDYRQQWPWVYLRFNRKCMFEGHALVSTGPLIDADKAPMTGGF